MAADSVLRVITKPLTRGHLIDLIRSYENSGFFETENDNGEIELLITAAQESFPLSEVFPSGPLKGKRVREYSARMQTYSYAPCLPILTADEQAALTPSQRYHANDENDNGYPFVITLEGINRLAEIFSAIGKDGDVMRQFLKPHLGEIAVFCAD